MTPIDPAMATPAAPTSVVTARSLHNNGGLVRLKFVGSVHKAREIVEEAEVIKAALARMDQLARQCDRLGSIVDSEQEKVLLSVLLEEADSILDAGSENLKEMSSWDPKDPLSAEVAQHVDNFVRQVQAMADQLRECKEGLIGRQTLQLSAMKTPHHAELGPGVVGSRLSFDDVPGTGVKTAKGPAQVRREAEEGYVGVPREQCGDLSDSDDEACESIQWSGKDEYASHVVQVTGKGAVLSQDERRRRSGKIQVLFNQFVGKHIDGLTLAQRAAFMELGAPLSEWSPGVKVERQGRVELVKLRAVRNDVLQYLRALEAAREAHNWSFATALERVANLVDVDPASSARDVITSWMAMTSMPGFRYRPVPVYHLKFWVYQYLFMRMKLIGTWYNRREVSEIVKEAQAFRFSEDLDDGKLAKELPCFSVMVDDMTSAGVPMGTIVETVLMSVTNLPGVVQGFVGVEVARVEAEAGNKSASTVGNLLVAGLAKQLRMQFVAIRAQYAARKREMVFTEAQRDEERAKHRAEMEELRRLYGMAPGESNRGRATRMAYSGVPSRYERQDSGGRRGEDRQERPWQPACAKCGMFRHGEANCMFVDKEGKFTSARAKEWSQGPINDRQLTALRRHHKYYKTLSSSEWEKAQAELVSITGRTSA